MEYYRREKSPAMVMSSASEQVSFRCSSMAYHHLAQLWQEMDFHPRATILCLPHTSLAVSMALICLLPRNWHVMRRELPPGATVLQGQCCNFFNKRENGQAGSSTAMDEILGISPPVYFTARLYSLWQTAPTGTTQRESNTGLLAGL